VAPSSAKIGSFSSFSETFSQWFFNEMNRPVIIQQVVDLTNEKYENLNEKEPIFADDSATVLALLKSALLKNKKSEKYV
jgi:hypothetical protein